MLTPAKPSLTRLLAPACAAVMLLIATGCSSQPIIRPLVHPPPLAACDYISVGPLNGWIATVRRDSSYAVIWGQGLNARVPPGGGPVNFDDIYELVTRIRFDAPANDETALKVIITAGAGREVDQFVGATTSVEEIKLILEAAQVGARDYWPYSRPTLEELQAKYPLVKQPRQ